MQSIALKVQKRDTKTPASDIRKGGLVPGICYGSGKENVAFQVDYQVFRKVYNEAGENTVIDLDVDGDKHKALVHTLQFDPLYNRIDHIDMLFINMKKAVTTHVPVEMTGEAPAVKELLGSLNVVLDEIEVKCLPSDIPDSFTVDISVLVDFNAMIRVSDLVVPENVEILDDLEQTVIAVSAPRVEEEVVAELTPEEQEKAAIEAAAGPEPERATSEKEAKPKD